MTARPDPQELWPPDVFNGLDPNAGIPRMALQLRLDPHGRMAPGYYEAMWIIAEAARLRWRPTSNDLQRLDGLRPGKPAEAARYLCLMAAVVGSPVPLGRTGLDARYARTTVAWILQAARKTLRMPKTDDAVNLLVRLERPLRDLRWPFERRVYEQWRASVKGERATFLEVADLAIALTTVAPPSPREVTTVYARALDALAAALARSWRVSAEDLPRLRAVARDRGAKTVEIKRDMAQPALLEALQDREVPQWIRRTDGYVVDEEGARLELRPALDVPAREYLRWLRAESIRRARHALRDAEPYQQMSPGTLDALEAVHHTDDRVARRESTERARIEMDRLRAVATPRQAEVLDALVAALETGADMEEARSRAAEKLDIAPSTLRTHWERLVKKAAEM